MKFGEDCTSSFGEEDVLTDYGRTHGRTKISTRWWRSVNHVQSFKLVFGQKIEKNAQDYPTA